MGVAITSDVDAGRVVGVRGESARSEGSQGWGGRRRVGARVAGFTLADCLVMLGVALVGVAVLLPVVERARHAERAGRCADNLRVILSAVRAYAWENAGALPGSPWTSSGHLRRPEDLTEPVVLASGFVPTTRPSDRGPVALFDWMTPVAERLGMGPRPGDETARLKHLLTRRVLNCPENTALATPTGDPTRPVLPAPGYRANLDFLLVAPPVNLAVRAETTGLYFSTPEARVPLYYRPRLDRVGDPGGKAFLTEAAGVTDVLRAYLPDIDGGDGVTVVRTTYPADPVRGQRFGGAMAAPRPYARMLGDRPNPLLRGFLADASVSPGGDDDAAVLLLARHGTRSRGQPLSSYRTHLGFLDGRVERMDLLSALSPDYHSPRGTTVEVTTGRVYPRVIQQHLSGRENPEHVVR